MYIIMCMFIHAHTNIHPPWFHAVEAPSVLGFTHSRIEKPISCAKARTVAVLPHPGGPDINNMG